MNPNIFRLMEFDESDGGGGTATLDNPALPAGGGDAYADLRSQYSFGQDFQADDKAAKEGIDRWFSHTPDRAPKNFVAVVPEKIEEPVSVAPPVVKAPQSAAPVDDLLQPLPAAADTTHRTLPSDFDELKSSYEKLKAEMEEFMPVREFLKENGVPDGKAAAAHIAKQRADAAEQKVFQEARVRHEETRQMLVAQVQNGELTEEKAQAFFDREIATEIRIIKAEGARAAMEESMKSMDLKRAELEVTEDTLKAMTKYPALKRPGGKEMLQKLAVSLGGDIMAAAEQLDAFAQATAQSAALEGAAHRQKVAQSAPIMGTGGGPAGVPKYTMEDAKKPGAMLLGMPTLLASVRKLNGQQ